MTTAADLLRPEPKRDRWGRYLITPADGGNAKAHTRATTWAKTLEDTYSLEQWGNRMIVLGLASRPDLIAGAAACTIEDKSTLNSLAKQAKDAVASGAKATMGTALHRVTQRRDVGEDFEVPSMFVDDVKAYEQLLAGSGIEIIPELVERIVVLPDITVAGTFDRLVRHEGKIKVADLKTGSVDYAWLAIAIQLALYANAATMYDPITETHEPMPEVDKTEGLVLHVPYGSATAHLYRVDLTAGWEAARLCGKVRDLRNHKGLAELVSEPVGTVPEVAQPTLDLPAATPPAADSPQVVETPAIDSPQVVETAVSDSPQVVETPAPATLREWIIQRLRVIIETGHAAAVAKGWPDGLPTLKASDAHTDEELDLVAAVLTQIESEAQLPFPEHEDPRTVAVRAQAVAEEAAEAKLRVAFPGITDELDEIAPKGDCENVIFALKQATPEVLAGVQEICKASSVPNLQSGRATQRHLEIVLAALDTVEKGAASG